MRTRLLSDGAKKLEYEIRDIVKKAEKIQALGQDVYWENIGDPIQKNASIPVWMKEVVTDLVQDDQTYGYCHSKGVLETRKFLAERTNKQGGVQITENDILFFNGLGDAIHKVYQYLHSSARVMGPSPAYSTHSSAESAHARKDPIVYKLDPENNWYPDVEEIYLSVKYNPSIVGILVINPDNPTGMVYPKEILERIVEIAKEFKLFIISDEIYNNITYNGAVAHSLSEVIGDDVPGIAMKGISKELPWPGSRCGWMEFYNRDSDTDFNRLCDVLDDAKMIEVCSTTLPQKAIPELLGHPEYPKYRKDLNDETGRRSKLISSLLGDLPQITFNETFGAFYNTIVFKKGFLKKGQNIDIQNPQIKTLVAGWTSNEDIALDKVFVYYLLASKGVCVVPLSSFHSDLEGFRVTLLEENEEVLQKTFTLIREGIKEFCS